MLDLHLIDYKTCHDYAAERGYKLHLPKGDWYDIGSDAYLLSIRRAWRATADCNPEAFAKRLMYTAVLDVIRRRNYKANLVYLDSAPVVEPDANDDSPDDEPLPAGLVVGDQGQAAEKTRSFDEDWENPLWLRLFNCERQKLRNERGKSPIADLTLRFIRKGLKTQCLWTIKASLRISGSQFQTILNFFQERFALCFQALREFRNDKTCPLFRSDKRP